MLSANFAVLKLCNALRKAAFYLHQPIHKHLHLKSQILTPVVLGEAESREKAEEFKMEYSDIGQELAQLLLKV